MEINTSQVNKRFMTTRFDELKKNYAELDDQQIEYIAKYEAKSLAPEVILLLIKEMKNRGFDNELINAINPYKKELSQSELRQLKNKITHLACPECGQKKEKLVGSLVRTVKSFLVLTMYSNVPIITCEECARKKRTEAMLITALLGWWAIPFGIIRTPIALIASLIDRSKVEKVSDEIVDGFVVEYLGEIRTNLKNEDRLIEFINDMNKQD